MKKKDANGKETASCCDDCDCCKDGKCTGDCDCCKGKSDAKMQTVAYVSEGTSATTPTKKSCNCCKAHKDHK